MTLLLWGGGYRGGLLKNGKGSFNTLLNLRPFKNIQKHHLGHVTLSLDSCSKSSPTQLLREGVEREREKSTRSKCYHIDFKTDVFFQKKKVSKYLNPWFVLYPKLKLGGKGKNTLISCIQGLATLQVEATKLQGQL